MKNKFWLLHIWGDVEPMIKGPYSSEKNRIRAAKKLQEEGGVFKIDSPIRPKIEAFSGVELEN